MNHVIHVVLFRPKAVVSADLQCELADAVAHARREIPSIRRFDVGRRLANPLVYNTGSTPDYPFAAIAEFDDREGLAAYLVHPAHLALGRALAATSDSTLVFDYEAMDGADARSLIAPAG